MRGCTLHILHSFDPVKKIDIEFNEDLPELESVEQAAELFRAIADQYGVKERICLLLVGEQIYWIRRKKNNAYQFWRLR